MGLYDIAGDRSLDLVTASDGTLFLAYIYDNTGTYHINTVIRRAGQPLMEIPFPEYEAGWTESLAAGFDYQYPESRPLVSFTSNSDANYIHRLESGVWYNITSFEYANNYGLANWNGTTAYFSITNASYLNMINPYYDNYSSENEYLPLVNDGRIWVNGNPRSETAEEYGIMQRSGGYIYLFRYSVGTSIITEITNFSASEYGSESLFNSFYTGPGDNNFSVYNVYEENTGYPTIEIIEGNLSVGPIFRNKVYSDNQTGTLLKALKACYDWQSDQIYYAVADSTNSIRVYRFDTLDRNDPVQIGDTLQFNINHLDIAVHNRHVYLALVRTDGIIEIWDYQD